MNKKTKKILDWILIALVVIAIALLVYRIIS